MKLLIGLGNPGSEYENTRHNAGFIILEELRKLWEFPDFVINKKFNAEISEGVYNPPLPSGEGAHRAGDGNCQLSATTYKLVLVRPQTFMNNSGETIRKMLDFYKLAPDDIVVIQDDLDIEKGKYKISTDSSSAGHHGIDSLIENLGTQKFKRFRIGIGKATADAPACRLGAHDYVLQKFSEEELTVIKNLVNEVTLEVIKYL